VEQRPMSVQPIFAAYLRERARANKQESERERSKGQERVREREGRGGRVHNLEPQNAYFRLTHPNIHEETRVAPSSPLQGLGFRV